MLLTMKFNDSSNHDYCLCTIFTKCYKNKHHQGVVDKLQKDKVHNLHTCVCLCGAVTLVDMLVDVVVYYADSQQCHTVSR